MLCGNLDGWSGFGGGREIVEAGVICIRTADSLPCTAETNTNCKTSISHMGFSRQEYQSALPFPSTGDLPNPGIKPASPPLADGFFIMSYQGSLLYPVSNS